MGAKSKAVDAYIARSAPFAQPILRKVRALFHEACPDIQETMKWSFPHFEHKGLVGSMAAFKHHAGFGFWKASLMRDPQGLLKGVGDTSMGGLKLTSLDEMPTDRVVIDYILEAVALNEAGIKAPRPARREKPAPLAVPPDLRAALRKNKKAQATFDGFSPSHRREYIEWLTEAKQEQTRKKRLETAIEWMAQGKTRNWKYER